MCVCVLCVCCAFDVSSFFVLLLLLLFDCLSVPTPRRTTSYALQLIFFPIIRYIYIANSPIKIRTSSKDSYVQGDLFCAVHGTEDMPKGPNSRTKSFTCIMSLSWFDHFAQNTRISFEYGNVNGKYGYATWYIILLTCKRIIYTIYCIGCSRRYILYLYVVCFDVTFTHPILCVNSNRNGSLHGEIYFQKWKWYLLQWFLVNKHLYVVRSHRRYLFCTWQIGT